MNSGIGNAEEKSVAVNEDNTFLDSLIHATAEDFTGGRVKSSAFTKKKIKKYISNLISTLFGLVCFCTFIYCIIRISLIYNGYRTSDDLYGSMADEYRSAISGGESFGLDVLSGESRQTAMKTYAEVLAYGADEYTEEKQSEKKQVSETFMKTLGLLEKWRAVNPDVYGYIEIPDKTKTRISFPIMQGSDNDYYLTHSMEKKYLTAGAIFADFRNYDTVENNRNLIVYGHNLSNGGMFHYLVNYIASEDYFQSHDIIVSTFDGIYTFSVFSVYETNSKGDYVKMYFSSDAEFVEWCLKEESQSKWHKESISFDGDSVILTLSTCINGTTNGRYAVHGLLVKIEN